MNRFPGIPGVSLRRDLSTLCQAALCVLVAALAGMPVAAQTAATTEAAAAVTSGPMLLRKANPDDTQAPQDDELPVSTRNPQGQPEGRKGSNALREATRSTYQPGEFERYVQQLVDNAAVGPAKVQQADGARVTSKVAPIRRLGAELIDAQVNASEGAGHSPLVPPDYIVQQGDELVVTLWGSVDGDLRQVVDRSGRISIPRVGAIMVAGVRYADLPDVISRRVAMVFKNFQLSVGLGQIRGIRVFVTGFANKPGLMYVNGLSTLSHALFRAGGPAASGSFRDVQLRRGGKTLARFDLYALLLDGDRTADQVLQPDDVIHVGPIGPQVAVIGSVNRPAVFELKPGESVDDVLRMAGGFAAVADTRRLAVERLEDRASVRVAEINLPDGGRSALRSGDVVRAFNAITLASPVQRQNKRVRVEGEVAQPGEFVMPAGSTLADALRLAGGLTPGAYLFGTEFSRESVRATQQENYDRALRDLETDMARSSSSRRVSNADEAASQSASSLASSRLIERLRAIRPSGRVVLQIAPLDGQLPELALEDGDRLYVPPKPSAVGVFGSVFNAGNYLHSPERAVEDYLRLAGGPTRGADSGSIYVVRANGSVISSLQDSTWLRSGGRLPTLKAEPGDTIFVPEELDKTTFIQNAKDWTQLLYQFGIGLAGIKAATQ